MKFSTPLYSGILQQRYKRFLADVRLDDGRLITAHSANTGSMRGCAEPGSRVWLLDSGNPKRKHPFSWELVEALPNVLVGINTTLANRLVAEAIQNGTLKELHGYQQLRTEVRYGQQNSRIDLLLSDHLKHSDCYVEVKNVTLVEDGIANFPDAVSVRASKHLQELLAMVRQGYRGVLCFCVQRRDAREVRPADSIDPTYGRLLREVQAQGVEVIAYQARVTTDEIILTHALPVTLD